MTARHVVVVGAGAAGLTAAIRAGAPAGGGPAGARVTLLNAHPRVGLKILMSGGTRCNVTHREVSERDFHGGSRPFVARVLRAFTVEQTIAWFSDIGVELKLEETGKYFPVTDDAQTVLAALLGRSAAVGVTLDHGARVVRLEPRPGGGLRLGIQRVTSSAAFGDRVAEPGRIDWPLPANAPDEWLEADAVVLASGGLSFPRTGSDGSGYALATALGHTLAPPVPALTPLRSDEPWCVMLKGVTTDVELTLRDRGKVTARTAGSMLWAHFGYSGPAALDLSRHWMRAAEPTVTLSVAPGRALDQLEEEWLGIATREPRVTVRRFLTALMPDRLAIQLCGEAGVGAPSRLSQVTKERRRGLLELVTARPLRIDGTLGYEKAEVTAGGVTLSEVNPSTLESRVVPGLYLCGEILDVEGRLGGFNFQWSWSSGTVAGKSAGR